MLYKEQDRYVLLMEICARVEGTIFKWFTRFRKGNFDLEDGEHSGRLAVVDDDDQIKMQIKNNPSRMTRDNS